ncbi:MAG: TIGR00270 family protein [Methanomicrobiales archaeon]|jgi:putative transcription factor|nr:TIGR00270 family protein [Methanomicrobiales archaeon]
MSECEVCGTAIPGEPILVQIDGAKVWVCPKCARLGTEISKPPGARVPGVKPKAGVKAAPIKRSRDVFDMMGGDIIDDFHVVIRDARMAKGWGLKDLALEIKEKENLIKKIETGFIPEDQVLKKIEKVLEIQLIEKVDSDMKTSGASSMTTTLGDVIRIKKQGK